MATLIEFFDKPPVENVISTYLINPSKVFFIGPNSEINRQWTKRFKKIMAARKKDIEVEYFPHDSLNVDDARTILEWIIQTQEDCIFDIRGGKETSILALGEMIQQFGMKSFHVIMPNIWRGTVRNLKTGKDDSTPFAAKISLPDYIKFYSGQINSINRKEEFDDYNYRYGAKKIWQVAKRNLKDWKNTASRILSKSSSVNMKSYQRIINELYKADLLIDSVYGGHNSPIHPLSKYFDVVADSLEKNGNILEMYVGSLVWEVLEEHDKRTPEVYMGVGLDWDLDDSSDIFNEIDVMVMRGYIPVFISCKIGALQEELYKLETVSSHFSGDYGIEILVSAEPLSPADLDRAQSNGIYVIDNLVDNFCIDEYVKSRISEILFRE